MSSTINQSGPSDKKGGEVDVPARNLWVVLLVGIVSLSSFLSYTIWQGVTSAAPFVIGTSTSLSPDHLLTHGYKPEHAQAAMATRSLAARLLIKPLSAVERGERLYRHVGCILCHGPDGRGGVKNPNYLKGTFPPLDQVASRLFLEYQEDAEVVIDLLSSGVSLDEPSNIDIPGAGRISSGYQSLLHVIINGNPASPKDTEGTEPISMPSCKKSLTRSEINDLLAYFLTLYQWDEDEE